MRREVRLGLLFIPLIVLGALGALAANQHARALVTQRAGEPAGGAHPFAAERRAVHSRGGDRGRFFAKRFSGRSSSGASNSTWAAAGSASCCSAWRSVSATRSRDGDAALVTGLLGAFWGVLYLVRRSAVAAMVSHAGFNLVEIFLALASTSVA